MVNGLINQFTTKVMVSPLGILKAFTILPKSIFSIMGKIMIQIKIAIGIETLAYSSLPKVSGTTGNSFPIAIPATMHKTTHRVR